jgi:hypothetical protein
MKRQIKSNSFSHNPIKQWLHQLDDNQPGPVVGRGSSSPALFELTKEDVLATDELRTTMTTMTLAG